MTLVEDHRADTRGGDAVDEGPSVRVEVLVGGRAVGGQQVAPDPLDPLAELVPIRVGIGLGHPPDTLAGSVVSDAVTIPGRRSSAQVAMARSRKASVAASGVEMTWYVSAVTCPSGPDRGCRPPPDPA